MMYGVESRRNLAFSAVLPGFANRSIQSLAQRKRDFLAVLTLDVVLRG
jgi:hypothetical protein